MSVASKRQRIENSYEQIEGMEPGLRACVHEYGFAIVNQCLMAGIRKPAMIHQLVREIWAGARQPRQKMPKAGILDWLLLQAGAEITAAELGRVLKNSNLAIVPLDPTREMIDASLATVSRFDLRVTKREKHRLRLKAELAAGANYIERNREQAVDSPIQQAAE